MRRAHMALLTCLASAGASSCVTEACGCTPAFVPALITGRVFRDGNQPVPNAQVRAYSAPAENCHTIDTDFGVVSTEDDGTFRMGLPSSTLRDSVCVFVFARPPRGAGGLTNSDTSLVALDFRDELRPDSVRLDLALRRE